MSVRELAPAEHRPGEGGQPNGRAEVLCSADLSICPGLGPGQLVVGAVIETLDQEGRRTMDCAEPYAELNDDELAQEITLLGEVMSAAGGVGRVLTQAEIDVVLGVCGRQVSASSARRVVTARPAEADADGRSVSKG
jgi:hypothetical protein